MITALVIVVGVIIYALVGTFVFSFLGARACKKCGCMDKPCNREDAHYGGALVMGIVWPVAYPLYMLAKLFMVVDNYASKVGSK